MCRIRVILENNNANDHKSLTSFSLLFVIFFIILEMSAYKCRSCNGSFSEVEAALIHVNTHEKFQKGCVHPKCKYKKQTRLSLHSRKQHSASCKYICICKSVFVRAADLSNHVRFGHCKARLASASTMEGNSKYVCQMRMLSAHNLSKGLTGFTQSKHTD